MAILKWAGCLTGLYPKDDLEVLRVDEILGAFIDLMDKFYVYFKQ